MILNKRVSTESTNMFSLGLSACNQSMEVEKTRSTPSVRWHQISTSISSMMASTTRIQTISGGEGDSAAWSPDLRFDIKNPPPVSRGGLTITRAPVSLPKWPHPLAGTTLPRLGRLARASAALLMHIQNRIFIDGSRGPHDPSGTPSQAFHLYSHLRFRFAVP